MAERKSLLKPLIQIENPSLQKTKRIFILSTNRDESNQFGAFIISE